MFAWGGGGGCGGGGGGGGGRPPVVVLQRRVVVCFWSGRGLGWVGVGCALLPKNCWDFFTTQLACRREVFAWTAVLACTGSAWLRAREALAGRITELSFLVRRM